MRSEVICQSAIQCVHQRQRRIIESHYCHLEFLLAVQCIGVMHLSSGTIHLEFVKIAASQTFCRSSTKIIDLRGDNDSRMRCKYQQAKIVLSLAVLHTELMRVWFRVWRPCT